jgi:hypothetical protein
MEKERLFMMEKKIIDNQKLEESLKLLSELYDHMQKRTGKPDPNNYKDHNEGTISVGLNFIFSPYMKYSKDQDIKNVGYSITVYTNFLQKQHEQADCQFFGSIDAMLNQIKNWHGYEMSLKIEEN